MARSKYRYREFVNENSAVVILNEEREKLEQEIKANEQVYKKSQELRIAIYVRVSVRNKESESIDSQLMIARRYIEELKIGKMKDRLEGGRSNEIKVRIYKYIDEGVSGYSIEKRGAMRRLLKDVDNGEIDCIIVKDISRLGRNYILINRLLEDMQVKGIRVISVTENYDSFKSDDKNYMNICIKNMLNDMYIKDTGRKISMSKEQLMRQGIYVGVYAPYGYICREGKMYVDEKVAWIVRQMYSWYIERKSVIFVIDKLEQKCINTKKDYRESKRVYKKGVRWSYKSVKDVLTDEIYIGNLVQKKTKREYGLDKIVREVRDKVERIKVEHSHEEIIESQLYDKVQSIINKREN